MRGPRAPAVLAAAAGAAAAVGSLLTWATVRLDLSQVFGLFPPDYRQPLGGLELGGGVTLAAATVVLLSAGAVFVRPTLLRVAGTVVLAASAVGFMWSLYHVVRARPLALAAIEEASGRPGDSFSATASVGAGPFVVIGGAVVAMIAGVLLVAGPSGSGRHAPGMGRETPRDPEAPGPG